MMAVHDIIRKTGQTHVDISQVFDITEDIFSRLFVNFIIGFGSYNQGVAYAGSIGKIDRIFLKG